MAPLRIKAPLFSREHAAEVLRLHAQGHRARAISEAEVHGAERTEAREVARLISFYHHRDADDRYLHYMALAKERAPCRIFLGDFPREAAADARGVPEGWARFFCPLAQRAFDVCARSGQMRLPCITREEEEPVDALYLSEIGDALHASLQRIKRQRSLTDLSAAIE